MQAHKYSNSTTADLWSALSEASGKPIVAIAAGWTEQPGFPVVNVSRESNGKVALSQQRLTVNFRDNTDDTWENHLTYFIHRQSPPARLYMSGKMSTLEAITSDTTLYLSDLR